MSDPQFCMSCGREFVPTPRSECQCIGCDALRRIAGLEDEKPALIAMDAFDEMRAEAKAKAKYVGDWSDPRWEEAAPS